MWRGRASQQWINNDPEQLLFPTLFAFQNSPGYQGGGFGEHADELSEREGLHATVAEILAFTTDLLALANDQIEGNINSISVREAHFVREFQEFLNIFNNISSSNTVAAPIARNTNPNLMYPISVGVFNATTNVIAAVLSGIEAEPNVPLVQEEVFVPMQVINNLGEVIGPATTALEILQKRAVNPPNRDQMVVLTEVANYLNILYANQVPERPPLIFLTGGAGTGKSVVFSCVELCHFLVVNG